MVVVVLARRLVRFAMHLGLQTGATGTGQPCRAMPCRAMPCISPPTPFQNVRSKAPLTHTMHCTAVLRYRLSTRCKDCCPLPTAALIPCLDLPRSTVLGVGDEGEEALWWRSHGDLGTSQVLAGSRYRSPVTGYRLLAPGRMPLMALVTRHRSLVTCHSARAAHVASLRGFNHLLGNMGGWFLLSRRYICCTGSLCCR